jgi:mRNA-degrading endonuclease RelE of RelBE toxin-antitoxin system
MKWTVFFKKKAQKQLDALPEAIREAVQALERESKY